MAEKKSRVGSGMKPRTNQRKKQETAVSVENKVEMAANAGQVESLLKPVLDKISTSESDYLPESENAPENEPETHSSVSLVEESSEAVSELEALMGKAPDSQSDNSAAPEFGADREAEKATVLEVGEQPDGTTKIVVDIPEGYMEGIRQWAESDGVTVERWLSDRLYEYVVSYGNAPAGR